MKRQLALVLGAGFVLGVGSTNVYLTVTKPEPQVKHERTPRPAQLTNGPIRKAELTQFAPLPQVFSREYADPSPEEVALGRQFFYDPRFSRNHDISCNSCHPLAQYGMDGKGISVGHLGQTGRRNALSVYHAAGSMSQFWDGRARSVEQQAPMPVLNPFEMAMDEARVLTTLRAIPDYTRALHQIFPDEPDPVTLQNFGYVVGAFERGLLTPSRWDRFLLGDDLALSPLEQQGFTTFYQLGCSSCHYGSLVGGGHFEMLGQVIPWPNQTDFGINNADSVATMPSFKVPSLRNVEKTAPYFHDASSTELADAVRQMAIHQLGFTLTDEQVRPLIAWLKALTGELPERYIQKPKLPEATASLPAPEGDG